MARMTDEQILKLWSKETILERWNETRRMVFYLCIVLGCVSVLLATLMFSRDAEAKTLHVGVAGTSFNEFVVCSHPGQVDQLMEFVHDLDRFTEVLMALQSIGYCDLVLNGVATIKKVWGEPRTDWSNLQVESWFAEDEESNPGFLIIWPTLLRTIIGSTT